MKIHKNHLRLLILLLLVLLACVGYMTVGVHFENQKLFAYAMRIRTPKLIAMLITAFAIGSASIVFGVGRNEKHSRSPVPSSDSRSFIIEHDDVIASVLQILDHLPGGNLDDSRYVLTDDAMRAQLSDNSEHLRPEVTVVPFTILLSSHTEGLERESAGNNVNCS